MCKKYVANSPPTSGMDELSANDEVSKPQAFSYRKPPSLKKAWEHSELAITIEQLQFKIVRAVNNLYRSRNIFGSLQELEDFPRHGARLPGDNQEMRLGARSLARFGPGFEEANDIFPSLDPANAQRIFRCG